ncbi:MAG: aldo/keto reductase, partial [Spirochaetaceae bacterium]|nr:aldo/keto reductase [Spirochaetaceae bacterium]
MSMAPGALAAALGEDLGNDERLDRAGALAREAGCTTAQLAIAYVLSHGPNLYAIVGTRRPERLAELPKALKLALARTSWSTWPAAQRSPEHSNVFMSESAHHQPVKPGHRPQTA